MNYPRPSLTVDAVVLTGEAEAMQVLVIERANDPFAGAWAFPGGFVDEYENPFAACLRELEEETGLKLAPGTAVPLSLRTREGRDPRGWTISQPFLFHLPQPLSVKGADDARHAIWVPLKELPHLAFDHGAILCEALGRFWDHMPTAASALERVRGFGCPSHADTSLTFFGGSFNPVHEGHRACIEAFPDKQTLVVVPDNNPFKDGPGSRCYWQLYRSLQETFDNVAGIFPGFCGMEMPNPTFSWLPLVPIEKRGFLMGDDSLASLPNWYEAAHLLKHVDHLYVAPRRAREEDIAKALAWVKTTNPHCQVFHLPDHPWRDESSTRLRQQPEQ